MPAPNTPASNIVPHAQRLTHNALAAVRRFSHVEAVSGVVLVLAAIAALLWANLLSASGYESFWQMHVGISLGTVSAKMSLQSIVNDGLMTIFFLVVGMEIRSEIKDGSLSNVRMAILPIMAALGGVCIPALVYTLLNEGHESITGWAVPTATDIAFAMGALALLGKTIPSGIRVFLLALAIIDDIVAVLIIGAFYSHAFNPVGALTAAAGIAVVLMFQRMGIANGWLYIIPGVTIWAGLEMFGVHPTLAGVILGLMTPVYSRPAVERPLVTRCNAIRDLITHVSERADQKAIYVPLSQIRKAQRELLAPVQRVQAALHPWVAYGIMPLFALANAGVQVDGLSLGLESARPVYLGIFLALVLGKPVGVILSCVILVKSRLCRLPEGVQWRGIVLIGLLAGIGFTMSIFMAGLAFEDHRLLDASKLSVLAASGSAAMTGILWGLGAFIVPSLKARRP